MNVLKSTKKEQTINDVVPVITKPFRLSQNLLNSPMAFVEFQQKTGLADQFWQVSCSQAMCASSLQEDECDMTQLAEKADGFVIFLHGWDGSHRIWEDLPMRLVERLPNVVCLNLDANGFGQSPFLDDYPKPGQATLTAGMVAVEEWLKVTGLWPLHHRAKKPFYLFVGHSMGAGMAFYKNQHDWQDDSYGCYVMAPGIFYQNKVSSFLYKLVASATRLPGITPLKNLTARLVIFSAMRDASHVAQQEHAQIFYQSSFKTLADTLYGIGDSPKPTRTDWSQYQVTLGHADILVRTSPTVKMLKRLGFAPHQIKVLVGDHYFFTYDEQSSPINHKYNRQIVTDDLVTFCEKLGNL